MSKSNGQSGQLDIVRQIIEAGCVVTVGEHEIRLTPPARATIAHLHQPTKDEGSPESRRTAKLSMYNMTAEAVKACIPGLDLDGQGLVALSGGEFGELSEKAMHLCGLQFILSSHAERSMRLLVGRARARHSQSRRQRGR